MPYPYSLAAAGAVLDAAEAWRDAVIPNTSSAAYAEHRALVDAIDAWRSERARPQEPTP